MGFMVPRHKVILIKLVSLQFNIENKDMVKTCILSIILILNCKKNDLLSKATQDGRQRSSNDFFFEG